VNEPAPHTRKKNTRRDTPYADARRAPAAARCHAFRIERSVAK
jgi:hypothetical protein